MPQRVADEVGDDDVEPAAVQPHRQPGRRCAAHPGPVPGPQYLPAPPLRRRCLLRSAAPSPASKREISIRSPTRRLRWRISWPTRRAAAGGVRVRLVAEDVGHRGHRCQRCPQFGAKKSPANWRARASICSSSPTLPCNAEAMVLNAVTSWASSVPACLLHRADRSPPDICRAASASRRTGPSTRLDAANARPVIVASSSPAAARTKAREVARAGASGPPGPVGRPPHVRVEQAADPGGPDQVAQRRVDRTIRAERIL